MRPTVISSPGHETGNLSRKFRGTKLLERFACMTAAVLLVVYPRSLPPISQKDNSMPSDSTRWGALQIIDAHAHIGSFRGYDLRTENLIANLNRFGIRLALISNIDGAHLPDKTLDLDEITANNITLQTVRKYPEQLRGLAWSRPTDPKGSPANLEPYLRDHGFVGVKLHPDMNQFPADSACVDGYLALCAKYKVPAVFHSDATGSNSGPEKIYAAAKRHPTVPIVLYHMGFLGPHNDAIATVIESLQKKDAELYLETSQADPEAVLQAIKAVGADRVLFGSDATYYGQQHYEQYLDMIDKLQTNLRYEDFAKVVRENAKRLFKL